MPTEEEVRKVTRQYMEENRAQLEACRALAKSSAEILRELLGVDGVMVVLVSRVPEEYAERIQGHSGNICQLAHSGNGSFTAERGREALEMVTAAMRGETPSVDESKH